MAAFVLTDFFRPEQWQGNPNVLLKVGGKQFANAELDKELDHRANYLFLQSTSTLGEATRNQQKDIILNEYIEDVLFEEKFQESGIVVMEKELEDLVSGQHTGMDNQHAIFKSFFKQPDESGGTYQMTSDDIIDWIYNRGYDVFQYNRYLYYKDQVKRQVNIAQYKNAIARGLHATSIDAKSSYIDKNQKMSGQYIYLPCNTSTLSNFSPSNKDIKSYYKNNKEDFINNKPVRELTYFVFDCIPSAEDSVTYIDNFNDLSLDFSQMDSESEDFQDFVTIHSSDSYNVIKLLKDDYNNMIKDKVVKNDIILPYFEKQFCKMGRVLDTSKDSVSIVYLEQKIEPSDQTARNFRADIQDVMKKNPNIDNIKEFAKTNNVRPRQVVLEKADKIISGLGDNRSIVMQLFREDVKLHETQYFDIAGDRSVIAIISKISEDEYLSLEDVRDDIEFMLITKDNIQTRISEINNFDYTQISDLATKFNTQVKNINQLSMSSDNFGNEGYQPDIVGHFFSSQALMPIIAKNGIFIFDNFKKKEINLPTDFNNEMRFLEGEYRKEVENILLDILKEDKDIVDNRARFY